MASPPYASLMRTVRSRQYLEITRCQIEEKMIDCRKKNEEEEAEKPWLRTTQIQLSNTHIANEYVSKSFGYDM